MHITAHNTQTEASEELGEILDYAYMYNYSPINIVSLPKIIIYNMIKWKYNVGEGKGDLND